MSHDDGGSDTSVEGLIERFRQGYPLQPRSPRRAVDTTKTRSHVVMEEDRSVEQDIERLHRIVKKHTPRHLNEARKSTSPLAHQRRAVSPVRRVPPPPPPPLPSVGKYAFSPRHHIDEKIAEMLLEQQEKPPKDHSTPRQEECTAREVQVNTTTADIIRKTALTIDKDMTHALAGFVERNALEMAAEAQEEEKRAPVLPVSALNVATELDAAFELLTKKAKSYTAPPMGNPTPSADARHAAHVIRSNGITTQQEVNTVLQRLEKASEAAAATSPQLDHIIHAQAVTGDRDLNAILARLDSATTSQLPTLFAPTEIGMEDNVESILEELQRVKATAVERTQAIQDMWKLDETPANLPFPPQNILYNTQDIVETFSQIEEEDDNQSDAYTPMASVSALDIVQDLSIAMHTLRLRLNLDVREQQEKEDEEKRDKEKKAKAAADAAAATRRAEDEKRQAESARIRVMGRTACEIANDDDDPNPIVPPLVRQVDSWSVPKTTTSPFDDTNVLLRFDMLVREIYDEDDVPESNQFDGHRPSYEPHPNVRYDFPETQTFWPYPAKKELVYHEFKNESLQRIHCSVDELRQSRQAKNDCVISSDWFERDLEASRNVRWWNDIGLWLSAGMEYVESIDRILRQAERKYGRTTLSLLEVLQVAVHAGEQYRHLHRILLNLSLEPEEDWRKKLMLYATRLAKANQTRDRFLDVLNTTAGRIPFNPQPKEISSKQSSIRNAHVASVRHDRVLNRAFSRWKRRVHAKIVCKLDPLQVRAIFRWLQHAHPAPVHVATWSEYVVYTKNLPISNIKVLRAVDQQMCQWLLARIWREWIHHISLSTKRSLAVERKWLHQLYRRRDRCFHAWRDFSGWFGPRCRLISSRHTNWVRIQTWQCWKKALDESIKLRGHQRSLVGTVWRHWVLYTRHILQAKLFHDHIVQFHHHHVKKAVWRAWQKRRILQHKIFRSYEFYRCRRLLHQWHLATTQLMQARRAMRRNQLTTIRRVWLQWRAATKACHRKHCQNMQCDAIANIHSYKRAVLKWTEWCIDQQVTKAMNVIATEHAERSLTQKMFKQWLALLLRRRRLRMLQTTLPRVFLTACNSHCFQTWRMCTRISMQEAVDATRELHHIHKRRFWRRWKKQKVIGIIISVIRRQIDALTQTAIFAAWKSLRQFQRQRAHDINQFQMRASYRQLQAILHNWSQFVSTRKSWTNTIVTTEYRRSARLLKAWRDLVEKRQKVRRLQCQLQRSHEIVLIHLVWSVWAIHLALIDVARNHQQSTSQNHLHQVLHEWQRYAKYSLNASPQLTFIY
ncbi:hypothetical protein AeMF1_014029 [Aphanomyces euteiches]|nr:hypothetical protein AeMF1_014029 [Aphanomyces euteiches]KAH9191374.1 hypothetical protein AeNC1_006654 [Aphanomyces euteiches]